MPTKKPSKTTKRKNGYKYATDLSFEDLIRIAVNTPVPDDGLKEPKQPTKPKKK